MTTSSYCRGSLDDRTGIRQLVQALCICTANILLLTHPDSTGMKVLRAKMHRCFVDSHHDGVCRLGARPTSLLRTLGLLLSLVYYDRKISEYIPMMSCARSTYVHLSGGPRFLDVCHVNKENSTLYNCIFSLSNYGEAMVFLKK